MNKNKKGFTIVELVIVIAVIAILAAVLIPTFSNIIKSANKSADTQLVKNLNDAVVMGLAENNETKAKTAYEAMQYADANGYSVEKIVAKSDYNIAWSVDTGEFVLIDTTAANPKAIYPTTNATKEIKVAGNEVNYFVVVSKLSDAPAGYSVYAGVNWPDTDANVTIKGVGFDAGANNNITSINYTNNAEGATAKDVVIRTNGGTLTINDTNDASHQYHYGYASTVNVATGTSCYECHAIVESMTITAGKAIAGESAYVGLVSASSGVTLEEKDDGIFVIPETAVASKIDATVAAQIDYTISGNIITASADKATKAAAATQEVNNKLDEQASAENTNVVARIGGKGYSSIVDAFTAAQSGDTIKLLADCYGYRPTISSGITATLDLNGHTLTATQYVGVQGNLTVKDTSSNGNGKIYGNFSSNSSKAANSKIGAVQCLNGTLIVEGGTIESKDWYGIVGESSKNPTITINGGTIIGKLGGIRINSTCTLNINAGTVGSSSASYGVSMAGGTATVTGGTITGKSNSMSLSSATLTISGGTINCMFGGSYTINSITGGTFNFDSSRFTDAETALKDATTSGSTITINGETYTKQ